MCTWMGVLGLVWLGIVRFYDTNRPQSPTMHTLLTKISASKVRVCILHGQGFCFESMEKRPIFFLPETTSEQLSMILDKSAGYWGDSENLRPTVWLLVYIGGFTFPTPTQQLSNDERCLLKFVVRVTTDNHLCTTKQWRTISVRLATKEFKCFWQQAIRFCLVFCGAELCVSIGETVWAVTPNARHNPSCFPSH